MSRPAANLLDVAQATASAGSGRFSTFRRLLAGRSQAKPPQALERCELCAAPLAADHDHLLRADRRELVCACRACAILFSEQPGGGYRRVGRRFQRLRDFQMTDLQWEALGLPVGLAFFYRAGSPERIVAVYPSPAGPTETPADTAAWADLVAGNPALGELAADVEGLIVDRVSGDPIGREGRYCLASIDRCFELVGLVRRYWRGLSGGSEVRKQIGRFFEQQSERT